MKSFLTAVVIGFVLIIGGIIFDGFIDGFSDEMLAECEKLEKNIAYGNESATTEAVETLLKRKKTQLASVISHRSIDEIENSIAEISGYIKEGRADEARIRCAKLRLQLMRLPVEYKLSIQNIL